MERFTSDYWTGIAATISAIVGAFLTYWAARLRLRYEGITAGDASRIADRVQFREEMKAIVEEARKDSEIARHTAERTQREAKEILKRNHVLENENLLLRQRISVMETQIEALKKRLTEYDKRLVARRK